MATEKRKLSFEIDENEMKKIGAPNSHREHEFKSRVEKKLNAEKITYKSSRPNTNKFVVLFFPFFLCM